MDTNAYEGQPAPPVRASLEQILDEVEALSRGAENDSPFQEPPAGGPPPTAMGTTSPPSQPGGAPPPSPLGGAAAPLLNGLLSNPALLSALPTLMEKMAPLLGAARGSGGGDGTGADTVSQGGTPGQGGAASPVGGLPVARPSHAGMDRHTALLCAVKPYLNPQRRAAADTMIQLCRVWDALEKSGISLGSLLGGLGGVGSANTDQRR